MLERTSRTGVRPLVAALFLAACGGDPPQTAPDPFPEDTDDAPIVPTGSTTTFPLDSGFTGPVDDVPEHTLHVRHAGSWTLSGSPPTSLGGTLRLTEIVDELEDTADTPDCEVELAMTGVPPEESTGCPCDFVFDVAFQVTSGELGSCRIPDLPTSDSVWRMGYSGAEGTIYLNYQGSGVYVPWYPAEQVGDTVVFEWELDLALELEEEP